MVQAKGVECGNGWISADKKCRQGKNKKKKAPLLSMSREFFEGFAGRQKDRNIQNEINRIKYNSRESATIVSGKNGNVINRAALGLKHFVHGHGNGLNRYRLMRTSHHKRSS